MLLVRVLGISALIGAAPVSAEECRLPAHHAGVTVPIERVPAAWTCRLHPIITNFTTANKIGPIRTRMPQQVFAYLLDHPPVAAALVNRLDIALYQAHPRPAGAFWGSDGEGTEGILHVVYRDAGTRLYYLEGRHDGRLLPTLTGKAVVLVRFEPVTPSVGIEEVDATLVSYLRVDNRWVSGVLSLLRPFVGQVVIRQLTKGFDAADRLGRTMVDEPDRVLFEAADPPSLPDEDVRFLQEALSSMAHSSARLGSVGP